MSVLIDSNVLLRRAQPSHPAHACDVQSVAKLLANNTPVYFTPQNIIEFWNVATRPAEDNGLGLTQEIVLAELATIEELLIFLPDSPAIFVEWKRLVTLDARLAAVAIVEGADPMPRNAGLQPARLKSCPGVWPFVARALLPALLPAGSRLPNGPVPGVSPPFAPLKKKRPEESGRGRHECPRHVRSDEFLRLRVSPYSHTTKRAIHSCFTGRPLPDGRDSWCR